MSLGTVLTQSGLGEVLVLLGDHEDEDGSAMLLGPGVVARLAGDTSR